ncbi:MAG: nucleoside-diphosphate sugar epimerase/dehydratase [candidate division WOR-3 bacterium]
MEDAPSHKVSRQGFFAPMPWKRTLFYVVSDAVIVLFATFLTYAVATQHLPFGFKRFGLVLPYAVAGFAFQCIISFLLNNYNLKWSTFSLSDVPKTMLPGIITAIVLGFLSGLKLFATLTPWSAITWGLLNIGGVISVRLSKRFYQEVLRRGVKKKAILVVGSEKGYFLIDVLRRIPYFKYDIVGFVDPDPANRGCVSQGLKVLGTFDEVERIVKKHRIRAAFIFLSSHSEIPLGRVYEQLHNLNVQVKVIPSLAELIESNGRTGTGLVESLAIHQLTGRAPVAVDPEEMERFFANKRVLITGAGGSIGSELCRQIARFHPEKIILFERDDSNLFYIEEELRKNHPEVNIYPFLGDITHEDEVSRAFEKTKPEIVFHAAAYKHVPILEFYPLEAIKVNVLGTHIVARAAVRYGIDSFVYISTDKAVNPTSVMGATKRLGEMLVTAMNGLGDVRFVSVRFGNVLASRGSVLTLFVDAVNRRQPIYLTDPEMKRYFMLTSEAVLLVMQAAAIGNGGEVFVLDMGRPVRIKDLAESVIRAAGLEPERDIPIIIKGRRPGEKDYEEILTAEEGTMATIKERIFKAKISNNYQYAEMSEFLKRLERLLGNQDLEQIKAELKNLVPNYQPDKYNLDQVPTASGLIIKGGVK